MDHRQKKRYMKRLGLAIGGICLGVAGCQRADLGDGTLAQIEEIAELQMDMTGEPAENMQEPPLVDGDRLWSNTADLVGQRYWAKERAAIREKLTASLVALGWEVQEQVFEQGRNLVATYPPSASASFDGGQIIVGAHYDTVQGSPGADDNATGVAVLLELAALYSEQQRQDSEAAVMQASTFAPQKNLTLVFFDQEEQGLLGSLAFTAEPGNLAAVQGVVVLDMLGASCEEPGCQQYPEFLDRLVEGQHLSDRGDFIAVVGEAERPGLLGAFGMAGGDGNAALPPVLRVPVPFKGLLTPDVLRSDHAPFWLNGIGAVLVTDTANLRNPHYHQPSDDLSQVNRAFFQGVAQQVVNGVWRLLAQPLTSNSAPNWGQPDEASS